MVSSYFRHPKTRGSHSGPARWRLGLVGPAGKFAGQPSHAGNDQIIRSLVCRVHRSVWGLPSDCIVDPGGVLFPVQFPWWVMQCVTPLFLFIILQQNLSAIIRTFAFGRKYIEFIGNRYYYYYFFVLLKRKSSEVPQECR